MLESKTGDGHSTYLRLNIAFGTLVNPITAEMLKVAWSFALYLGINGMTFHVLLLIPTYVKVKIRYHQYSHIRGLRTLTSVQRF